MDRNIRLRHEDRLACRVATREGGVDRNDALAVLQIDDLKSPPARVAWIETF